MLLGCLRDQLGVVFAEPDFADLYPKRGQPAYAPWRLALVTLIQFREGLSDRQAAEAVRGRSDWKYLLALDLTDDGFDFSVLCESRARLLQHGATERLLARLDRAEKMKIGTDHSEPAGLFCCCWPKRVKAREDAMELSDRVIGRIAIYPRPRGGVEARRV